MTLRSTNLNLLPVLQALLREVSITRAAQAVGLSQPATSQALGRLRQILGDPLLVQVGRSMHRTARAERLMPLLDSVCADIEMLLLAEAFDPATLHRDFAIATPDYLALLVAPMLIDVIGQSAPGVRVRFIDIGPDFRSELSSGAIDIAIIARIDELEHGLSIRAGYRDQLVAVVARTHPLARSSCVNAGDLAAWPHIAVDHGQAIRRNQSHGIQPYANVKGPLTIGASHLLMLPFIAAQSGCVAIVPRALADHAAGLVAIHQLALPDAAPLDICQLWSPRHDTDAAHGWLRQAVDGALRQVLPACG